MAYRAASKGSAMVADVSDVLMYSRISRSVLAKRLLVVGWSVRVLVVSTACVH